MVVRNLRWIIVSLVALATVINYIDRNALAILWGEISADLGLDKDDYANIVIVFMIGYAIGQTLFGKIFDMIGTRFGFVLALAVWSVFTVLHAVVRGFTGFAVVRFFLGVSEAGNWPGATKSNAEWFPIKERSIAQGIFNSGASLGSVISPPLVAGMALLWDWQVTFIILGSAGLLWIVPWLVINKAKPESHPWLSEDEREYILTGQRAEADSTAEQIAPSMWQILSIRQSWSVIGSRFFLDPVWWLFVAWLPIYLTEQFGFDLKGIALFAWVPYVGAAAGALLGGWVANRLIKSGRTVNYTRKLTILVGAVFMFPSLIATAYAAGPNLAIGLITLILFGFQFAIGNIQTLPSDYFSDKSVGSLAGLGGTSAIIGVIICMKAIPALSEISYAPVFLIGAALVPLALICVWLFGGRIEPLTGDAEANREAA